MKSLLCLLNEEARLTEQFNEMLCTIELASKHIKNINTITIDCQDKQNELERYKDIADNARTRAHKISMDIVSKRGEIAETFDADRVSNYLMLDKEIEDIILKG